MAEEVLAHTRQLVERGQQSRAEWHKSFDARAEANPEGKAFYDRMVDDELTPGWEDALSSWEADPQASPPGRRPARC